MRSMCCVSHTSTHVKKARPTDKLQLSWDHSNHSLHREPKWTLSLIGDSQTVTVTGVYSDSLDGLAPTCSSLFCVTVMARSTTKCILSGTSIRLYQPSKRSRHFVLFINSWGPYFKATITITPHSVSFISSQELYQPTRDKRKQMA